jgi:hypothetical protein
MTDHPRFERFAGHPDDAYRNFHGARIVRAFFSLVDWWTSPHRLPAGAALRLLRQVKT